MRLRPRFGVDERGHRRGKTSTRLTLACERRPPPDIRAGSAGRAVPYDGGGRHDGRKTSRQLRLPEAESEGANNKSAKWQAAE